MPVTATPIYAQSIKNWAVQILPADVSNWKTLVTGGTNGSLVESINVASNDGTARDVQFSVTIGAVTYLLTTINVVLNAGFTNLAVPPDILRHGQWPSLAFDMSGSRYIYIASGTTLNVKATTTVTAAKSLDFFAQGGDF